MNFNKFINSDYLKSNPLCGISTYKDELNLATGACTRRIKKLVLTGDEGWGGTSRFRIGLSGQIGTIAPICTHYRGATTAAYAELADGRVTVNGGTGLTLAINDSANQSSLTAWKSYLAAQYANGTPVTVWYVLSTPTTETITVPSGLSGTEEGYIIQDGTPTPTNPIYPTANTVEKWFDIPHYIHNTSTDTLATLPADIYANDTTATVGLKGQMEQSGAPTPTNPIQPSECGDKTANLYDTILPLMNIDGSGKIIADINNQFDLWIAQVTAGEVYSASAVGGCYAFYSSSPSAGSVSIDGSRILTYDTITFTVPNGANYIAVRYNKNSTQKMCNSGSRLLPYEPYGYKIPILSGNTTTPVYLGEVETTRRIKKLVLTGQEDWTNNSNNACCVLLLSDIGSFTRYNPLILCNYVPTAYQQGDLYERTVDYGITFGANAADRICIRNKDCELVSDFKQWLAQQYAAGTPVTVWYVLATPETAIVNEPIRKIGDYADTVSGISVPTLGTSEQFDVDASLKPSEIQLTYTGWHDATVKEWDGSEWQ